jgi:transcription antitermination protein NusB
VATPKKIRQLAFQVLYQIDLTGGGGGASNAEAALQSIDEASECGEKEIEKVLALARAAFEARSAADARMKELAPDWPAHRQAAVDRAILRLAHFEMTASQTPPKVAVNEAVELAKRYSTERSPAFINALLDKVLKDVLAPLSSSSPSASADPVAQTPSVQTVEDQPSAASER